MNNAFEVMKKIENNERQKIIGLYSCSSDADRLEQLSDFWKDISGYINFFLNPEYQSGTSEKERRDKQINLAFIVYYCIFIIIYNIRKNPCNGVFGQYCTTSKGSSS